MINTIFKNDELEILDFKKCETFSTNKTFEEQLNDMADRINNSLDDWTKVKILEKEDIIKSTETEEYVIRHYKIRYRLYLSTIWEILGIEKFYNLEGPYWEKDENGIITHHPSKISEL